MYSLTLLKQTAGEEYCFHLIPSSQSNSCKMLTLKPIILLYISWRCSVLLNKGCVHGLLHLVIFHILCFWLPVLKNKTSLIWGNLAVFCFPFSFWFPPEGGCCIVQSTNCSVWHHLLLTKNRGGHQRGALHLFGMLTKTQPVRSCWEVVFWDINTITA